MRIAALPLLLPGGLALLAPAGAAGGQDDGLRVFISVDMEGISGIAHSEMTSAAGAEYDRGRDLLMRDLNAAVRGALDAGAAEILVNDSHGSMRNVRVEELLPPARLISHNSKPFGMMQDSTAASTPSSSSATTRGRGIPTASWPTPVPGRRSARSGLVENPPARAT